MPAWDSIKPAEALDADAKAYREALERLLEHGADQAGVVRDVRRAYARNFLRYWPEQARQVQRLIGRRRLG